MNSLKLILALSIFIFLISCEKSSENEEWVENLYEGSFINLSYSDSLIADYNEGVYEETEIPEELKNMEYGRIEIDFTYNGGALESFMPILYYGSINNNSNDDLKEATQFHLVVEIGHYNVVPFPIENLFYTICYDRYPLYCRDTYNPVIAGKNYTFIHDQRPEGNVILLKEGDVIVNSFPSAFFPDSSQLFFKDMTKKIEKERGDSLNLIMMIGQGFVGFEKGLHNFNGSVDGMKVFKYNVNHSESGYEIIKVKNQHCVKERISYSVYDHKNPGDGFKINVWYQFWPYNYENAQMLPTNNEFTSEKKLIKPGEEMVKGFRNEDIGFYKVYMETINNNDQVVNSIVKPFEFWVYPESWAFNY